MNMQWKERWKRVLKKIQRLHSPAELENLLQRLADPRGVHVLAFVNAHAMNSAADAQDFYQALESADTLLRDGSGMAALYRMLHMPPGLNLNGTDLIPKIIQRFNGRPLALYGTQEPFLTNASRTIADELAQASSIGVANGFLPANAYIADAKRQKPALIVLGMGMPKQELLANALRAHLDFPCLIVCGGAIIDFLGGKTQRAPGLFRTMGMEWLFRLALEPRRLFRRYVIGNPVFLWRALTIKLNSAEY